MKKSVPRPLTYQPYTHHPPHARLGGTAREPPHRACTVAASRRRPSPALVWARPRFPTGPRTAHDSQMRQRREQSVRDEAPSLATKRTLGGPPQHCPVSRVGGVTSIRSASFSSLSSM